MKVSLPRNIAASPDLETLRTQVGEMVSILEDAFARQVDVYYVTKANEKLPQLKTSDLVFDFTIAPGVATLQQWDGTKLIPLDVNTLPGENGEKGDKGDRGPRGDTGSQGPKGDTGAQGEVSVVNTVTGAPGTAASVTDQNPLPTVAELIFTIPRGDQGLKGDKGDPGTNGAPGTPGEKWYTGPGVPPESLGITGDWWLDSVTGDYYEKTETGTPTLWQYVENLKGPKGVKGDTGSPGANGVGVPTGGTTNQALVKTDATDFNTKWFTIPLLGAANTFTNSQIYSFSGTAGIAAMQFTGKPFAGTGTDSIPLFYINDSTTPATDWGTDGTYLGINGTGNADLVHWKTDGVTKFRISPSGLNYMGRWLIPGSAIELYTGEAAAIVRDTTQRMMLLFNASASMRVSANFGFIWSVNASGDGDCNSPIDTGIHKAAPKVVRFDDGIATATHGGTWSAFPTTPAQIAAIQHNYNPLGSSYFQRWRSSASFDVTGLTFTAPQVDGQIHIIANVGTQPIVIKHENAGSVAANRFLCTGAVDITLAANQEVNCWYDATTLRWRVSKRGF